MKISKNVFMREIGFEITEIDEGRVKGRLNFAQMHHQQNGILHGGVTYTISDVVAGFAAYSLVAEGRQVFTVDARMSYLNPGIGEEFFAEGWVIKAGKRFHFCESEVYIIHDGERKVIAKGSSTMAVV